MNKISKLSNVAPDDNEGLTYDYTRKIVSTKVTQIQFDELTRITKERFGLDTPYELLQLFIAVVFKYDSTERGAFVNTKEEVLKFISPFIEIDNKKDFIDSFKISFGQPKSICTHKGDIKR